MSIVFMVLIGIVAIFLLVEFRFEILLIVLLGYCLLGDPMDILESVFETKLGLLLLLIPIGIIVAVIEKIFKKQD